MQRDVLLRWLHQISLVIRRLLYGPGEVNIELAEEHIREALEQHLGPLNELITRLDPLSAANLLHEPDRIFGYAQLVGLQAAVLEARGSTEAVDTRERAVTLGRIAIHRANDVPVEWQAWLDEVKRSGTPGEDQVPG